jgi:hypothetical protein
MILATPVPVASLIQGNRYLIKENKGRYTDSVYNGIFLSIHRNGSISIMNATKIINIDSGFDANSFEYIYLEQREEPIFNNLKLFKDSIFYSIKEIRDNARKAIQTMEQRSLDLILKRLINEEFKW